MSSSHNQANVIGNLTADPEIRETPNGRKVATFSVATTRKWKNESGELIEDPEYHSVVAWGKLAEIIEQYVVKGMKVFVSGYLKTRSWDREMYEEKDGKFEKKTVKSYRTEIIADEFLMLSSKDRASKKSEDKIQDDEFPSTPRSRPKPEEEISIEDIPF